MVGVECVDSEQAEGESDKLVEEVEYGSFAKEGDCAVGAGEASEETVVLVVNKINSVPIMVVKINNRRNGR